MRNAKHGRDTGRRALPVLLRVVVAVAGLVAAALAGGARSPVAQAAFPGMNGRIALKDFRSIATMNPDGTGLTVIAAPPSGLTFANPAWSPKGTEIAFDDGDGIWIVEADGSNLRQLASIPSATHPTWSPDGSRIAYRVTDTVEVIDLADPAARTVLLGPPTIAELRSGPSWSPSGDQIAVAAVESAAAPSPGIAIVDLSGASVRFVTPSGVASVSDLWPDWSPDGTQIVFVRADNNFPASRDVYTVAADGGGPPQDLTPTHPDRFSHPVWSPDGTLIAAVTSIAAVDIWTMSATNGSGLMRLTFSDAADMPSWGPFTISVDSITIPEGDSGMTPATFHVRLPAPRTVTVTVDFAILDGTAIAGTDYVVVSAPTGTLTFNPGETTKDVKVDVVGDTQDEPDEVFSLELSNPTNVTIATPHAQATIVDDDVALPSVTIDSAQHVSEGTGGVMKAVFNVRLSAGSLKTVTVDYQTYGGTAAPNVDYVPTPTPVTLQFYPGGPLFQTISVDVIGDSLDEDDETFDVLLSNPTNSTIAIAQDTMTIDDDDPPPVLSIASVSVLEGGVASLTVTLSAPSSRDVFVTYSTEDGTAVGGSAPGQGDFPSQRGVLHFAAGSMTPQTIALPTVNDIVDELDESLIVVIAQPINATLAAGQDRATVIIVDDDTASLSIDDVVGNEGSSGTSPFAFTVSLSPPAERPITVDYATANASALAGSDYLPTSGTLTFNPGEFSKPVVVSVIADTAVEFDETFTVLLSNATAQITKGTGQGTIVNDDAASGQSETVFAPLAAGGTLTTDTEGDGATPSDPIETWVTTPMAGTVSISEVPTAPSTTAFFFLGWQVNIGAPLGTAANPLVLVFRLDASLLTTIPLPLQVFRNGVQVPDCTGAAGVAQPDPCVSDRSPQSDGDLQVTVLTSAASRWNFGAAIATPGEVEGDDLRPPTGAASFEVESKDGRIRGELRFTNGNERFRSHHVTALRIASDRRSAWIAGLGEDGRTFLAYVEDNQGGNGPDVFRLWIKGVSVTGDGALVRGDVRID